jgi:hypothetical protein
MIIVRAAEPQVILRLDRPGSLTSHIRAPTPAEAAALYREGMSACEIAQKYGITRGGAKARIRAGGLGGLQWCPICRTYEELRHMNAEAAGYMVAKWGTG